MGPVVRWARWRGDWAEIGRPRLSPMWRCRALWRKLAAVIFELNWVNRLNASLCPCNRHGICASTSGKRGKVISGGRPGTFRARVRVKRCRREPVGCRHRVGPARSDSAADSDSGDIGVSGICDMRVSCSQVAGVGSCTSVAKQNVGEHVERSALRIRRTASRNCISTVTRPCERLRASVNAISPTVDARWSERTECTAVSQRA